MGTDTRITQPITALESQRCMTRNATQAHSVPTVPGAKRDRPEPKPSAMRCAGCESRKRSVGRRSEGRGMAPEAGVEDIGPECRASASGLEAQARWSSKTQWK
ncbi:hypothetical protein L963_1189 [Leuconostoc mesenteroides subsp. cremoris T26]|nr:hypothetical protein L963_1189 [Leuconostoc mesenteroides subsp. cremoris T26]